MKKDKIDIFCMKCALASAELSEAQRTKVGAVIAKDGRILASGFNGTPHGLDNSCETITENGELVTKDTVVHAEMNAILFCAKHGIAINNSTLYVTLCPCQKCAASIIQSGIKEIYYIDEYRDMSAIKILEEAGISINKLTI